MEAYKHYTQLKLLIAQGEMGLEYQHWVNSGLDQIIGLINTLPIEDQRVLGELKDFQKAIKSVSEL